jgi:hypothetical protein
MGGDPTFINAAVNGEDAPIADLPALAPNGGGSTLKSHSSPRERMVGSAEKRTFTGLPHMLSGCSAAAAPRKILGFRNRNGSDLDHSVLERRELCCIRVLDEPSKQVGAMASTRHLAAILAADVAGYSRLMGADEEGTHERLQTHFRQHVDPKIKEHPRPDCQKHRRRPAGGIRQRRRRGALRHRSAAWHARPRTRGDRGASN